MKLSKDGIHLNLNIVSRIVLSYLAFVLLTFYLNYNNDNRITSFILVCLSAFIAIIVLTAGLKSKLGFSVFKYLLIGFIIKLIIGYLFWEFYIFPNYFTDSLSNFGFAHHEYLSTEVFMRDLAENRMKHGFFYVPPRLIIMIKHLPIHFMMSNMYLNGSYNPLDLSVQNTLFSLYVAIMIMAITNTFGASTRQLKLSLILSIYQPFSMISTVIWRDVFGQFFVALGGYLTVISLNRTILYASILILLASLSMLMQRQLYFFYPAATYMIYIIFKSKKFYYLVFIPFLILGLLELNKYFLLFESLHNSYGENLQSASLFYFLPINILRVFIGPFPWTQWFKFNDNTIFQISDYFQSVLTLAFTIMCYWTLKNRKLIDYKNNQAITALIILFPMFIFAAVGTTDIHQPYMTAGVVFLVPIALLSYTKQKFTLLFASIFCVFILLNVLFLLAGLDGAGFGSSFR